MARSTTPPAARVPLAPAWPVVIAFAVLTGIKLWLAAGFTLQAVGHANHDDELFVRLAEFIQSGQWLGPYDQFTLAKGPMYSIALAGNAELGLPLLTSQLLFYQLGVGVLVWASLPWIRSRGWLVSLLVILTFNPMTLDQEMHSRVLRQNILPGLGFLLLAWVVAWHARRDQPLRHLWGWSALGAFALPAFWLTREEGVWFLPALVIPLAAISWDVMRRRVPDRFARLGVLLLPFAGAIAGNQLVATLNQRHYGVRTTCEFKEPHFNDAFGSLLRLSPDADIPYTPVTRSMRERLYPLSPHFARLEPYFEGPPGIAWANVCSFVTGRPPLEREIVIGWTMWALRRAVVEYGGVTSGAEAADYYRQLAAEINTAADEGLIPAGPRRSGFLPPLGAQHIHPWLKSGGEAVTFLVTFESLAVVPTYSVGSHEELRRFAALTREELSPARGDASLDASPATSRRGQIASALIRAYALTGPWLAGATLLVWGVLLGVDTFRRRIDFTVWLAGGLLASLAAMLAIVALINVTSFPSLNSGYFTACYGVLILFEFVVIFALGQRLSHGRAAEPPRAATSPAAA